MILYAVALGRGGRGVKVGPDGTISLWECVDGEENEPNGRMVVDYPGGILYEGELHDYAPETAEECPVGEGVVLNDGTLYVGEFAPVDHRHELEPEWAAAFRCGVEVELDGTMLNLRRNGEPIDDED